MDWLIYLFGSGIIFFVGIASIALGLALAIASEKRWWKVASTLATVVGLLLIALSATPLPFWLYGAAGGATLLWLVVERFDNKQSQARRNWLRGVLVAVWIACILVELPYHVVPKIAAKGNPTFYVIGDSVTAGMSDGETERWPQLLARDHSIEVVDCAQMGATCSSAIKQADGLPADGGLLLLEIGGNDLLGATSAEKFGRDLDQLLTMVCTANRTVLMFELPLPPGCNEYGRSQRSLAAKHDVILLPKRVMIAVLATNGATVDSIHLAPEGHQKMADFLGHRSFQIRAKRRARSPGWAIFDESGR